MWTIKHLSQQLLSPVSQTPNKMPLKFGFKSRLFSRSCVDLSSTRARGVDSNSDLVITVGFRGSQVALGHCSNDGKDDRKQTKGKDNSFTSKKKDKGSHSKNRDGTSVDPKPSKDQTSTGHAQSNRGARRKQRVRSTGQLPMLQECTYTSNGHAKPEQGGKPPGQAETSQAVTSSKHITEQDLTPQETQTNSQLDKLEQNKSTEGDKNSQILTESNGHIQSPHESKSSNEDMVVGTPGTPSSIVFTPETSKTNTLNVASSGAKRHTACLSASRVVNTINSESSKANRRKSSGPLSSLSTGGGGGLIRRRSKGKPDVVHWKRKVCFVVLRFCCPDFPCYN